MHTTSQVGPVTDLKVRVPRSVIPIIDQAARQAGMSRSEYVRTALKEAMHRDGFPTEGLQG